MYTWVFYVPVPLDDDCAISYLSMSYKPSPPVSCCLSDGTGWCGLECASTDDGLLAHAVHHCSLCGAPRGPESLRGVPTVLLEAVQWTAAHSTDTYGKEEGG